MILPDTLATCAPFVVREVSHFLVMRGRLSGSARGGHLSVLAWNACYLTLLVMVAWGLRDRPLDAVGWMGYGILWAAIIFRMAAFLALRRFYSVFIVLSDRHRLVTNGPYRWLRHPLHVGLVVEMAGLALMTHDALAAIPLGVAVLVLIGRNVVEERALTAHFGEAYRSYASSALDVVDLLPRRWRA